MCPVYSSQYMPVQMAKFVETNPAEEMQTFAGLDIGQDDVLIERCVQLCAIVA